MFHEYLFHADRASNGKHLFSEPCDVAILSESIGLKVDDILAIFGTQIDCRTLIGPRARIPQRSS